MVAKCYHNYDSQAPRPTPLSLAVGDIQTAVIDLKDYLNHIEQIADYLIEEAHPASDNWQLTKLGILAQALNDMIAKANRNHGECVALVEVALDLAGCGFEAGR